MGAIEDFLDAVFSHGKWHPGTPIIHDISKLDSGSLTVKDIKLLAGIGGERRERFGDGKIAIVACRDLEFGLARMLNVFVDDKLDSKFAVFRSRKEALDWLSV